MQVCKKTFLLKQKSEMNNEDSLRTNYLCNKIFKQIMALQEMALFLDLPTLPSESLIFKSA